MLVFTSQMHCTSLIKLKELWTSKSCPVPYLQKELSFCFLASHLGYSAVCSGKLVRFDEEMLILCHGLPTQIQHHLKICKFSFAGCASCLFIALCLPCNQRIILGMADLKCNDVF